VVTGDGAVVTGDGAVVGAGGPVAAALAGVRFGYPGGRPVLDGADLSVAAGGRLALLGANGCGKTTVLRCLSGALRPAAGTVTVDGGPVDYSRAGLRRHRRAVQLVTQDPDDQLFSATVGQDVAFGPVNLGLAAREVADRVDEALGLLSVEHLRDRPTHLLSFGERKRVAIAGAVAMRPAVLALDEPTSGLDPAAVEETLAALRRLLAVGTTVVLSTHDVDLALRWADQIAVVVDGAIRQGAPGVLLRDTALLAAARLRPPWLVRVSERLGALGLLAERELELELPRTVDELIDLLPGAGAGADADADTGPGAGAASGQIATMEGTA
jgi:cobalt/nickel transport system ATP-binding protein